MKLEEAGGRGREEAANEVRKGLRKTVRKMEVTCKSEVKYAGSLAGSEQSPGRRCIVLTSTEHDCRTNET
jgi:hypothetical protein